MIIREQTRTQLQVDVISLLNSHFLCIGTLLVGNSTSKLSEMLMNSDCTEFWPMFNLHNRGGINSNMLVISEFHL